MSTYVIGDVHGCYYTLINLLNKLPSNARIIFVGDLCDRGSYSKEVIDYVIKNEYEVIMGNHEYLMINQALEAFQGKENRWTKKENDIGGRETILSYKDDKDTLLKHLKWMKELPSYILIDNKYFITHGFGLPYFKNRDKYKYNKDEEGKSKNPLIQNRLEKKRENWEEGYENYNVINIFGHIDFKEVEIGPNYFGIDTGCAYHDEKIGRIGLLTAFELGTHNIVQVECDLKDINN
jgi:serine/threonine protein phosphatase 1